MGHGVRPLWTLERSMPHSCVSRDLPLASAVVPDFFFIGVETRIECETEAHARARSSEAEANYSTPVHSQQTTNK